MLSHQKEFVMLLQFWVLDVIGEMDRVKDRVYVHLRDLMLVHGADLQDHNKITCCEIRQEAVVISGDQASVVYRIECFNKDEQQWCSRWFGSAASMAQWLDDNKFYNTYDLTDASISTYHVVS